MAGGGGSLFATGLSVSIAGGISAAVAPDGGGGTITVTKGTCTTSGGNSPGLYSTGRLTATGARFTATGRELR